MKNPHLLTLRTGRGLRFKLKTSKSSRSINLGRVVREDGKSDIEIAKNDLQGLNKNIKSNGVLISRRID